MLYRLLSTVLVLIITAQAAISVTNHTQSPFYKLTSYRLINDIDKPEQSLQAINNKIRSAEHSKDITSLHNALLDKGRYYIYTKQLDEALITLNLGYIQSLNSKLEHQILDALSLLVKVHLAKDLRIESLEYLHQGYSLSQQLKDIASQSWYLPTIVKTELETGNIGQAMEFALKEIDFFEQQKDTVSLSYSLLQLSLIHIELGNLETSQQCIDKANILLQHHSCSYSAYNIAHLSLVQALQNILENDLAKATDLCNSAYITFSQTDTLMAVRVKSTIAEILTRQKNYEKSNELLKNVIAKQKIISDNTGLANSYLRLAQLLNEMGLHNQSVKNYNNCLHIATQAGLTHLIRSAYKGLWKVYSRADDIKSAHRNLNKYTRITDSLYNAQKISEANKLEENAIQKKHQEELQAKNLEIEIGRKLISQQKKNQNLLFIIIGLFILIIVYAIRESHLKRKANKMLVDQKELIEREKALSERKTQNFTESLNYAQRMQRTILMSSNSLHNLFPESLTILIPKDIVSGDFYWFQEKNDRVLFALADCTGHGVPGAMMSIIGAYSLNRVVNEKSISSPGEVLNQINKIFEEHMRQRDTSEIFDGMDIALCSFNPKSKELNFAGANLPLYICRDNMLPLPTNSIVAKGKTHTLYNIKPTKQTIGSFHNTKNFTNHSVTLMEDDIIYLFSDGYADQFGGPEGRKFKSSQLHRLILNISQLPMIEQREILLNTFENWKGQLSQIDDVSFLGIKI